MKRVSVFAPMGTLDHQTGILNAVRCFAAAGYAVDVLTVRNRCFPAPTFASLAVRVRYMPWFFNAKREPRTLATLLFTAWVLLGFTRTHPLIFAGGIRGLLAAYAYSLFRRTRIVNYQTELYIGNKLDTRAARLFKAIERRAARRSEITIEHDEQRRDLLVADLGVPADRVLIVPNAPCGPARVAESTLLQRRLGLDEATPVLLCPGTIAKEFDTATAVRCAQSLPPAWRCVVHSAQPRAKDDPVISMLRELDAGHRVVFSLEPLPYSQIDELLGSARIGLVLYSREVGQNTSAVGLASGKLSHFLKLGVPVIVSPLPGLADFVREHGVGQVLEDPARAGELVAQIEADYAGYRERALRSFDERLSYDHAFRRVLSVTDQWHCAEAPR
ncbi:MAG: hypothetical protein LT106_04980 [Burkholderiaceae bacterium]|nr:hypothetical protein [Burkholderiaceae bacterium]